MKNHPTCDTCEHYESDSLNKGYCHLFSRTNEQFDEKGVSASAYDNFWVGEKFYCALHSELTDES